MQSQAMNNQMISVVTGASGFVGSHVVDFLIEQGHEVRCIIRKSSSRKWLAEKNVKIYDCGLDNTNLMQEPLKDCDYVFHVAGLVKAKNDVDYYNGNVRPTINILKVLEAVNPGLKRLVVVSSQTAAGPSLLDRVTNEEDIPNPITRYGKSKREQEENVMQWSDKLPVTIVRPPAVYGERDTEIYLVFKTFKMGLMTKIGFNKKLISIIYVKDLVRGIFLAATNEKSKGQIYFISSNRYYNWDEIGNAISQAMGRDALRIRLPHFLVYGVAAVAELFSTFSSKAATFNIEKARDFVQEAWTCDYRKAEEEIGFITEISLEEGMKRTISWYRENKWL